MNKRLIRIFSIVLWALAAGAIVTGYALGPHYIVFALAYLFLIAALTLTLGFWLRSRRVPPARNSRRRRARTRTGAMAAELILFFCLIVWLHYAWQTEISHGLLFPASDPTPPSTCAQIPKNTVALYAGGMVSLIPFRRFPHSLLSVDGEDRLRLTRRWDGGLGVSADFYDIRGNKLGAIVNNQLESLRPGLLQLVNRDRSTLAVKDRVGLELLRLRYVNASAIQLEVFLFSPGTGPIQIKGDSAQGPCLSSGDGQAEFRVHKP